MNESKQYDIPKKAVIEAYKMLFSTLNDAPFFILNSVITA